MCPSSFRITRRAPWSKQAYTLFCSLNISLGELFLIKTYLNIKLDINTIIIVLQLRTNIYYIVIQSKNCNWTKRTRFGILTLNKSLNLNLLKIITKMLGDELIWNIDFIFISSSYFIHYIIIYYIILYNYSIINFKFIYYLL